MARARNIKPSFFKNELLAEMDAFDRLLFVGLWCLADREGRIEDRPKRIKMELFPCDGYDVDAGLRNLEKHGFVIRYQAGEVAVVSVINFHKHQTPHGTEKDSELPDENGELTVHERTNTGYVSGKKRTNNVNSQERNVHPPLDNGAETVNPPGHNALNPDSLNPESFKEKKPRIRAAATTSLDGVPENMLADFIAVRKAKRAGPLTDTAIAGLKREAAKAGLTLEQAVRACIEFGWQGFNAGWYADRNKTTLAKNAAIDPCPQWCAEAGFEHIAEAENARCHIGNYRDYKNGKRVAHGVAA